MLKLHRQSPLNTLKDSAPARLIANDLSIDEKPFIRKTLLVGQALLKMPNNVHCLRLSPNQWLLLGEERLADQSAHVVDVTDKYQMFEIDGGNAAALLSTGCSLDLRRSIFKDGQSAQTRIEQLPIILYRDQDSYFVLVERTLTYHLWTWFEHAIREFI